MILSNIEIDPIVEGEVTWTNYGQGDIGGIEVEEQNDEPLIDISILGITGAVTGITQFLLSGWQIVAIIGIIGGILVVFIISRTMLKLKEK